MQSLVTCLIRTPSLWIAIGLSLILHAVVIFYLQPITHNYTVTESAAALELSLNKISKPKREPQPLPQEKFAQKKPQPKPEPSPTAAKLPLPKPNKVVQPSVVKPKIAPLRKSTPAQTNEDIKRTTTQSTAKQHFAGLDKKDENSDRELQKIRTDYLTKLAAWLNQHKRYPAVARRRGQEGEIMVRFKINTSGELLSHQLISPSKHHSLNTAVEKMLEKASPMPEIPVELRNGKTNFEYTIPVLFKLTGKG